jgi:hypothetical protein
MMVKPSQCMNNRKKILNLFLDGNRQWMKYSSIKKRHADFAACLLCLIPECSFARNEMHPLHLGNVHCLETLRPLLDFKLHFVTVVQGLVPIADNRLKMHEYIFAACARNESKPLSTVEPFDCSLFHGTNPFI